MKTAVLYIGAKVRFKEFGMMIFPQDSGKFEGWVWEWTGISIVEADHISDFT